MDDNQTIHGLWIEGRLSRMELLTLKSFVDHGHTFSLWHYGPITNRNLPEGVTLRDAAEILPPQDVFCYDGGSHPGSYAGFSDVFRYKLLLDHGGWWVDMDVTCLAPLRFNAPYVIRPHGTLLAASNVIKVPAGSELMDRCFHWAHTHIDRHNTYWLKPVTILDYEIRRLKLEKFLIPPSYVSDGPREAIRFATTPDQPHDGLHAIHWCNEAFKSRGIDKDTPREGTTYEQLMRRHGLV